MNQETAGWIILAVGIVALLARHLIDPSKPGSPGNFNPEVRRMRMMVAGVGSIILGLTMLFVAHQLPPEYSGSPFYDKTDHTNPNRSLGTSILLLMFSSLIGWLGVSIIRTRQQMVANQRRNPELVQPIDMAKAERQLSVMGWAFVVAGGMGLLWAAVNFVSWAGH